MKRAIRSGLMVLIILMAAPILFAEGQQEKSVATDGDDYPIELSVFTISPDQVPPEDNKIYKWIEDEFNVTFQWDVAVGEKDQKIGVMIASGDFPDLIHIDSPKFIDAGAVIPLEDLIVEHAPNLYKHYKRDWEKLKEDDGHIYCLPNYGVIDGTWKGTWYGDSAMWVQKEVLKEFGYPEITTMDEYFDLLIRYKEKYPTINGLPTIGFTILTYDWRKFCLINPPNFLAGYPNDGNGTVDPETHEYDVFLDQDISKRWFKKLNELNAMGLIDKNSFVDNYDQYMAKLTSGRVLGMHDQHWQFQTAQNTLMSNDMGDRTFAPLPVVFDESIRPRYRNLPMPNLQRGFGISVDAKDPVRIIKFLDAQMSEEAQRILNWGFEGEDWQYNEEGIPYRTQEQREDQEDPVWMLRNKGKLWFETAPKMEGSFSDGFSTDIAQTPVEALANVKPWDKSLYDAYGVVSYAELMDPDTPPNEVWFPAWQITPPDGSEAQIAWKRAEDTYLKWLPKIILADPSEFETLWAQYVEALEACDLDVYEEFVQEGIDQRIAQWGSQ